MIKISTHRLLFQNIRILILEAKKHVVRHVNPTLLMTNFELGRMIVENEQQGKHRADYASISETASQKFKTYFVKEYKLYLQTTEQLKKQLL